MSDRPTCPESLAAAAELQSLFAPRDVRRGSADAGDDLAGCGCSSPSPAPTPDGDPALVGVLPGEAVDAQPVISACKAYPLGAYRTNDNFIFLREILRADKPVDPVVAGTCLAKWLRNTRGVGLLAPLGQPNGQGGGDGIGVLVIDQLVELHEPIEIPSRMIISGVGINGAGKLRFSGLERDSDAITFPPIDESPSYAELRDISIEYAGGIPGHDVKGVGIYDVGDIVYLRRVAVRNWDRAFVNSGGYSVFVEQCIFENNGVHIDLVNLASNAMRIRECVFSTATTAGVRLNNEDALAGDPLDSTNANSCLITGCAFTTCQYGVFVDRHQSATIMGNSFVNDGVAGVYVTSNAREARILANSFDQGDRLVFEDDEIGVQVGTGHNEWGFNTVVDLDPLFPNDTAHQNERLAVQVFYRATVIDIDAP